MQGSDQSQPGQGSRPLSEKTQSRLSDGRFRRRKICLHVVLCIESLVRCGNSIGSSRHPQDDPSTFTLLSSSDTSDVFLRKKSARAVGLRSMGPSSLNAVSCAVMFIGHSIPLLTDRSFSLGNPPLAGSTRMGLWRHDPEEHVSFQTNPLNLGHSQPNCFANA